MSLRSGRNAALATGVVLTAAAVAGGYHFATMPATALDNAATADKRSSVTYSAVSKPPAAAPAFERWTPEVGNRTYSVGDFTVAISHGELDAVIKVSVAGQAPLIFPPAGQVMFSEVVLDRSAYKPQLLLRLVGGDDCCADEWLLTHRDDGLYPLKLGGDDANAIVGVHDLDGDGQHELIKPDNIFLNGFSEQDSGRTVPLVLEMADGTLTDRSADPAYRPYYEVLASEARVDCRENRTYAACAAYAAISARAGKLRSAMPLVTQAKGREDERLPYVCNDNLPCVDEDTRIGSFDTFKDALNFVLPALGYS